MKALLFDMDGTLVDSMGAWFKADLGYLEERGVDISKIDYDSIVTAGMEQAIELFKDVMPEDLDLEASRRYAVEYMRKFYSEDVKLKDGVREMLEYFYSEGIPMAIGSSTPMELCELALETVGIRHYFDFVFSASDENIPKDNPDFFNRIADEFQLKTANEMAVFDDAIFAIRAAAKAGSYVVGIADEGYPQNKELVKADSDHFIDDFVYFDFKKWLKDRRK